MRSRWGCLAAIAVSILVVLGGWIALRRHLGPSTLEQELAAARREGVPLELSNLREEAIPNDQNAAGPYLAACSAFSVVTRTPGWEKSFDAFGGFRSRPTSVAKLSAAERKRLRALIAPLSPGIAAFRVASFRKRLSLERRWGDLLLESPNDIRQAQILSQVLGARALLVALDDDLPAAREDLLVAARVAALLQSGRSGAELRSRIAMESTILDSVLQIVAIAPDHPALPELIRDVVKTLGPPFDFRQSLSAEVWLSRQSIALLASANDPVLSDNLKLLRFRSIREANEAHQVAYWRRIWTGLPADPLDFPTIRRVANSATDEILKGGSLATMAVSDGLGEWALDRVSRAETRRRVARATADVLAHRNRTGRLPDSLAIPMDDPFEGKIRYRREGTAFVVYSTCGLREPRGSPVNSNWNTVVWEVSMDPNVIPSWRHPQ